MGIQGLLPLLKSIMNPIHIKELEGCYVAVDTYSWLHKGALYCSTELCKGLPASRHIDYCMHRVNMLRHHGIKPILVFDGGPLPMKSDQEIKRARSRREKLSRAMEHESNGNKSAAFECYQKALDISPLVANDLIQVLKQENVSYVVAPYEADAQMTFLALNKQVEAVITEDSDLIAFGCPRIIYKMDKFGQGFEFKNAMIQHNKELNLAGFTQLMLLEMCILSGCDYLESLPGMGLKKAHALIKRFNSHSKVIKHLQSNGVEITPLYEESFKKAILTFRHQRVYDSVTEDIVHLSVPDHAMDDDLDFLGPSLPQYVAKGIAQGDLDPFTKMPIQRVSDATEDVTNGTYQLKNFKPDGVRKKLDLPVQKNLLTNYFCFASLEAKQKFKAPRITPKHPNKSNVTSSPQLHEAKHDIGTDLNFPEASDQGPSVDRGADNNELQTFNSVCKPCILLHKNSDRENGKSRSGNKDVMVRSSYFMNKSKETKSDSNTNGDKKFENVVSSNPLSALLDGTHRKVEKRVNVISYYFQNKKTNENGSSEGEKTAAENRKDRVRRSYFEKASASENNEKPECGVATEICNNGIQVCPSDNNSSELRIKRRKIVQTEFSAEDANDKSPISGMCSSEREEETIAEEGKFGCNTTHLNSYSGIAKKSMENLVSVISSLRYNSSGSRAPLKDIKNNLMKR